MRQLEERLEAWARWCVGGERLGATSIMQVIMAGGAFRGGSGAKQPLVECAELEVESALVAFAAVSSDACVSVDILRYEYGVKRLGNLPFDASQATRALRLNMSVRTYRRKLGMVKESVECHLINRGYL
jgi:hypothetical protein